MIRELWDINIRVVTCDFNSRNIFMDDKIINVFSMPSINWLELLLTVIGFTELWCMSILSASPWIRISRS
jgi:hypothetical protein